MADSMRNALLVNIDHATEKFSAIYGLLLRDRIYRYEVFQRNDMDGRQIIEYKVPDMANDFVFSFNRDLLDERSIDALLRRLDSEPLENNIYTFYYRFGNILSLYSLYLTIPSLRFEDDSVKIALMKVLRGFDIIANKTDEKHIELISNFDFVEMINNLNYTYDKSYKFIPTQRILSMSYVSLYYILAGSIPSFVSESPIPLSKFIEACTSGAATNYISYLTNNLNTDKNKQAMVSLINAFRVLTDMYVFNTEELRNSRILLDKDSFLCAIYNLGTICIQKLNSKESEDYNEILNNTIFGSAYSLLDLVSITDLYNYASEEPVIQNDINTINILFGDLSAIINKKIRQLDNNHVYFSSIYLLAHHMYTDIKLEVPVGAIYNYVKTLMAKDNITTISPYLVYKLLYMATSLKIDLTRKPKQQTKNLVRHTIFMIEALVYRAYRNWFMDNNVIHKTEERKTSYIMTNFDHVSNRLHTEIMMILLDYVKVGVDIESKGDTKEEDMEIYRELYSVFKYSDRLYNDPSYGIIPNDDTGNGYDFIKHIDYLKHSVMALRMVGINYDEVENIINHKLPVYAVIFNDKLDINQTVVTKFAQTNLDSPELLAVIKKYIGTEDSTSEKDLDYLNMLRDHTSDIITEGLEPQDTFFLTIELLYYLVTKIGARYYKDNVVVLDDKLEAHISYENIRSFVDLSKVGNAPKSRKSVFRNLKG